MALPAAHLHHATPGRARIRVSSKRGQASYFSDVEQRLARLPGVASVGVNHRTGSVLVHHTTSVDELLAAAEGEELFRVVEALGQASVSVPDALTDHLRTFDQRLRSLTGGDLDLRTLSLCTLLGLGVVETVRGNIASPATTLFWYAASLLMLSPGGNPSTNGGPSTEG